MSKLDKDLKKYTPRKEQSEAIAFIDSEYKKNKKNKFFLLNLPVGVGKSHLALMIADWYTKNVNSVANIDIITAGKLLQEQYVDTYDSINDLRGKENYSCSRYSCNCSQGMEFNSLANETNCEDCPYLDAYSKHMYGKISLTNFHLYLIYAMFQDKAYEQRKRNVLIVDECHELDHVISDFISLRVSDSMIKKLGFPEEKEILKKFNKINSTEQYCEFIKYLDGEVTDMIDVLTKELKLNNSEDPTSIQLQRDVKVKKLLGKNNPNFDTMQKINDITNLKSKLNNFISEFEKEPENWVLETTINDKTKNKELSVEPIWAYNYLDKYVWSKYDMVFLMSGTILNKKMFSKLNGIDESISTYYSIDSPFPIENRPLYYMPLGKMSFNQKEQTFQKYVPYLKRILKKYEGKKGIVHTNSFELSDWIKKDVDDSRLVFHTSEDRDKVIEAFKLTPDPMVLVSPSISTGVSFEHELSRFQVIAKIPYPSLASNKNKLRQKMDKDWYSYVTVCKLIQMTGRSVRSISDHAHTIILDSSFGDILAYSYHYLPKWFTDAIKTIAVK